jgi:hypothetical protein
MLRFTLTVLNGPSTMKPLVFTLNARKLGFEVVAPYTEYTAESL